MRTSHNYFSLNRYIVIILVVAVLIRIAYFVLYPKIILEPDSLDYYKMGRNIFQTFTLPELINPYRTPAYPLFINGIMFLAGAFNQPIYTLGFTVGTTVLIVIQSLLGLGTLLLLYQLMLLLKFSKKIAFVVSLMFALNSTLFSWEKTMLTEALAIPWSAMFTFLSITTQIRPTLRRFILLFFLGGTGFFIRPALMIFLPITLIFFILKNKHREVKKLSITVLVYYLLLILCVMSVNYRFYGYFGIQHVGEINLLNRIMQFSLPLESARHIEPIYTNMKEYLAAGRELDPWLFVQNNNIDIGSPHSRVQEFVTTVIRANMAMYIMRATADIPKSLVDSHRFYTFSLDPDNTLSTALYVLHLPYRLLQWVLLTSLIFFPIAFIRLLSKKVSQPEAGIALLGLLAFGHIVFTVMTGPGFDYGRYMAIIQPHLIIFCLFWSIRTTQRAKLKFYRTNKPK